MFCVKKKKDEFRLTYLGQHCNEIWIPSHICCNTLLNANLLCIANFDQYVSRGGKKKIAGVRNKYAR